MGQSILLTHELGRQKDIGQLVDVGTEEDVVVCVAVAVAVVVDVVVEDDVCVDVCVAVLRLRGFLLF